MSRSGLGDRCPISPLTTLPHSLSLPLSLTPSLRPINGSGLRPARSTLPHNAQTGLEAKPSIEKSRERKPALCKGGLFGGAGQIARDGSDAARYLGRPAPLPSVRPGAEGAGPSGTGRAGPAPAAPRLPLGSSSGSETARHPAESSVARGVQSP